MVPLVILLLTTTGFMANNRKHVDSCQLPSGLCQTSNVWLYLKDPEGEGILLGSWVMKQEEGEFLLVVTVTPSMESGENCPNMPPSKTGVLA